MSEGPGKHDPMHGDLLTADLRGDRARDPVALVRGAPDRDDSTGDDPAGRTEVAHRAAFAVGVEPGSTESRLLDAVVRCAARWGIDKTTVDDVAREAGVSRATVYRIFPGGKTAMVNLTTNREVVSMLMGLVGRVERCDSLADAVTELLCAGSATVADQPAIAYMRSHEPARLRAFFSFERLDSLFGLSADVLAPSLHRFLDPARARECVIWAARLVLSHYLDPDPERDLTDAAFARHLARDRIVAGLVPAGHLTATTTSRIGSGTTAPPPPGLTGRTQPTTQETQT